MIVKFFNTLAHKTLWLEEVFMAKVLDCSFKVRQFELKLHYLYPWERYKPSYLPNYGLIVSLLFFSKDVFSIR